MCRDSRMESYDWSVRMSDELATLGVAFIDVAEYEAKYSFQV